jgi:hypothetical protein
MDWATTGVLNSPTGTINKDYQGEGDRYKLIGWQYGELPPYQTFNLWMNRMGEMTEWSRDSLLDIDTRVAALDGGGGPGVALPIAQSDVTDLVNDLALRAPLVHTHTISDTTALQATLDQKALKPTASIGRITFSADGGVINVLESSNMTVIRRNKGRYTVFLQGSEPNGANFQLVGLAGHEDDTSVRTITINSIINSPSFVDFTVQTSGSAYTDVEYCCLVAFGNF